MSSVGSGSGGSPKASPTPSGKKSAGEPGVNESKSPKGPEANVESSTKSSAKPEKTPTEPSKAQAKGTRPPPAKDNYRGRYNAARAAEGKARLPEDWDAHHRIPQEYKDHPEFKDFDFHAPENIQGVKGSRADVNIHQDITNEWAAFRAKNPGADRRAIEDFARQMDSKFAKHWWK